MQNECQAVNSLSISDTVSRYHWLDSWRGFAVVWMIQTHCFNAYLDPGWGSERWYSLVNYANGLVAPVFLFIAGFVQGHAMRRVWARHQVVELKRSRLIRLLLLFFLGYAPRLPGLLGAGEASFGSLVFDLFCIVDILSCLAVALAVLLVIGKTCKNPQRFDAVVVILAVASLVVAPIAYRWTHENLIAQFCLTWMNGNYGALFPILPWFGFAAMGAVFSRWNGNPRVFIIGALGAWIGSEFVPQIAENAGSVEVTFFLSRLSFVFSLGAGFASFAFLSQVKLLLFVGQKSLLFYLVHLQIIYSVLIKIPFFAKSTGIYPIAASIPITFFGALAIAWMSKYIVIFKRQKQQISRS